MSRKSERSTRRRQRRRANAILRRIEASDEALPGDLEIEASGDFAIEAAAGDSKLPTFTMLAYSGGRMRPKGYLHDVVVDLTAVSTTREVLPILREHDGNRVVGHGSIQVDSNGIRASGFISGSNSEADEIVEASKAGFPWQSSIGARPSLEFIEAGDSVSVNGRSFDGPIYVSRPTVVREISIVAVGADDRSSTAISATGGGEDEMKFSEWLKANYSLEASALTDEQRTNFEKMWKAELAASTDGGTDPPAGDDAGDGGDDDAGDDTQTGDDPPAGDAQAGANGGFDVQRTRKEAAAESRRIAKIQKAGKDHPDLVATAIEKGWSFERFENDLLKAQLKDARDSRPSGAPAIHASGDAQDLQASAIECALSQTYGMSPAFVEKAFDEKTLEAAATKDMRGFTLHRLMHTILNAAGMSHPIGSYDSEFIRKTFDASAKLEASSGFSTLTLPGILSNTLNKTLLTSYEQYPSIIPAFCQIASSNDFKPFYSYRLEGDGILKKLGADGEIKHASLLEQEYMNQVETYARMLTLTRQMMINDDLGALLQVGRKLAEMSFKAHELAGVELLLNPPQVGGNDFFSVAHGNLLTGAGSALGIDSLSDADTALGKQTGSDGYPISIMGERLVVSTENKILAQQLMNDTALITGEDLTRTQNNPHAGRYQESSSAWLSNANVTGNSATAWFVFANPEILAAFQVAYLRGARSPMVESAETSFNTLGVQNRAVFDFGFGIQDYRGAVRADGA